MDETHFQNTKTKYHKYLFIKDNSRKIDKIFAQLEKSLYLCKVISK